jgi:hypothetical protein
MRGATEDKATDERKSLSDKLLLLASKAETESKKDQAKEIRTLLVKEFPDLAKPNL